MRWRHVRTIAASAVAIALLVHAARLPLPARTFQPEEELLFFPSGTLLEPACVGFRTLAADLCWLRAIQYYGQHRLTDRTYATAGHLFRTVSRLDPEFLSNYVFGAVVLAQDAGEPASALALLSDGMRARPDAWELPFEAGFVELFVRQSPAAAEPYFRRAAAYSESPDLARRFAARAALKAGDRAGARELWEAVARTTTDPGLRNCAERYLARIEKGEL